MSFGLNNKDRVDEPTVIDSVDYKVSSTLQQEQNKTKQNKKLTVVKLDEIISGPYSNTKFILIYLSTTILEVIQLRKRTSHGNDGSVGRRQHK